MSRGNNYDDEALARALQIEYEKEYRRRSMQQHLSVNSGNERSSSRRPVAPIPAPTAPIRPPPPFAPSASIDNIYIEEEAPYMDQRDVHRVGSHRGAAVGTAATPTGSVTVPRHSFTLAEDDAFGSVEISDEAFARQLEQEMIQEELMRKQRKQHLQQQRDSYRASNRGTSDRMDVPPPLQGRVVSTTPVSTRNTSINPNSQSYTTDYASRSSHSRNQSLSSQNSFSGRPLTTRDIADSRALNDNRKMMKGSSNMLPPAVTGTAMIYSDEELAMRLQQEMRDEELARQEFIEEQIRQSSIAARSMSENNRSNRQRARSGGRSSCRRVFSCLVSLILVGIAVALFLYFYLGADKVSDIIGDPSQFREEDPFNNANRADANLWKTKGGVGLELSIVNALDSAWQDYFFKAVGQWDAGTPDALTLTTEDGTPDSVCNAIDGKLKVCNGNYGATNWRGINKVLLENGWIYSSAARMNEYYTTANDSSQRQYTMCHEMGHGFGLPHTDENFFNKDLLNCMDYTNNPENNMQPSYANFKFLAQLYGTVDGSPVPTDDNAAVESSSAVNGTDGKGGRRRRLPAHVMEAFHGVDAIADNGMMYAELHGWRKLHDNEHGQAHEMDLGDGYVVQIHLLKA